ncbi:putative mRNA capping enzyme [Trypanosoma vivax]|uniref:mRNA (guanine-N(7))-methyltransferase n=1 Tax=Trypanosoma vivax (strain Y486) TaxID=1055687 RepID=G0U697_TRYVY|nr:putative mRNA capping methyltransferase [Trypanosoma vivax]KAH8611908.1 putative mRNA capping enzyme [Trypanosoma vivax]CCC51400.1 putative mRNA capping methyltransferase [Trypanosoma vivax Y486]
MEVDKTAASYDAIAKMRAGDRCSKERPFRFFNNYVKKALIQCALDHVKHRAGQRDAIVLELASGRGGDLGKWLYCQSPELSFATSKLPRERLSKAVFVDCYDISHECIAEAASRYEQLGKGQECQCSFSVRDCFSEEFLLHELPASENYGKFDIVSIQFALHYACSTMESIDRLLGAISRAMTPVGIFIATTVDEDALAARVSAKQIGPRGLFAIHMEGEPQWDGNKLAIGTKYRFELEGFVDCDEYVVPLTFIRDRARHYGMEELTEFSKPFESFYVEYKNNSSKNKGLYLTRNELELIMLYRSLCFRKVT